VIPCSTARAATGVRAITSYGDAQGGLAFDENSNPLMIERYAQAMRRVDVNDGSILTSTALAGSTTSGFGLTFDAVNDVLYTTDAARKLCVVDRTTGAVTTRTQHMPNFNFWDIEWEPATGKLWAVTDNNEGSLYTIDPQTGEATLQHNWGNFAGNGGGLKSMTFGPAGEMIISGRTSQTGGDLLWQVDRSTWEASVYDDLSTLNIAPRDIDYDPASGQWFAVQESSFFELTNVPEPTACIGAALLVLFVMSKRNRDTGL
jgi:hypothetical protein